jgi:hypothetical protein
LHLNTTHFRPAVLFPPSVTRAFIESPSLPYSPPTTITHSLVMDVALLTSSHPPVAHSDYRPRARLDCSLHFASAVILKSAYSTPTPTMDNGPCLCFPCIIFYLDGYVWPTKETQVYPQLARKGFTKAQQRDIAEEWYWVALERETAVMEYLNGYGTLSDGCWWRRPPPGPIKKPAYPR